MARATGVCGLRPESTPAVTHAGPRPGSTKETRIRSEASQISLLARLGGWIADRRGPVLAVMAALLAAASVYGASAASHLPAGGFEVPGSESDRAVKEAERRFGIGSADVLVLYRDPGADVRDAQFGARILDLLEPVLEDASVVGAMTYYDTAPGEPRLARRARDPGDRLPRRQQRREARARFRASSRCCARSSLPSR